LTTGGTSPSTWWGLSPADAGVAPATECDPCGLIQTANLPACSDCGGDLRPADVPRQLFGKYVFERRVGRGGMGVVYRARDLTLDRTVAIKTLSGASPDRAHRLEREARAMAGVTHRHLSVVYGVESWRGKPLLVCEYMENGTLSRRLASGPLPMVDGLQLGATLAEVLHVIHGAGFLHRDIKPSNIGYDRQNVVKLLDFGLVHIMAGDGTGPSSTKDPSDRPAGIGDPRSSTQTKSLAGTPLYSSPEALSGARPDVAFDLWSLNVLLIEVLTGRQPFQAPSVGEALERIRRGEIDASVREQLAEHEALHHY